MLKRTDLFLLTGFILIFLSCKEQSPGSFPVSGLPEVVCVAVKTQKIPITTELIGRTAAYRIAEVRPQVSGIIQKRFFNEGTDVKAGDILYQIDPDLYQASLESAQANLTVAKRNADRVRAALKASEANVTRQKATLDLALLNEKRFEESFRERAISALQRDQAATEAEVARATLLAFEAQLESDRKAVAAADASVQQAEAALKSAEINLKYTTIRAPISGRIGKSNVTEGALVSAYQPLALTVIQQLDPIYVDISQSTSEMQRLARRLTGGQSAKKVKPGNQVKLFLEDGTSYPLKGALQFRDVTVDPTTGSVILRALFPNPQRILLPGMFVRAVVEEGFDPKAILIPQEAVSRDYRGNPFALVVDSHNKVQLKMLTLDRAVGQTWLVTSGLIPGEKVVVEGIQKVKPGMTVKVLMK